METLEETATEEPVSCEHPTFEARVGLTPLSVAAESGILHYTLAVQVRCASCQGHAVFSLPPAMGPGFFQIAGQSRDASEALLYVQVQPEPLKLETPAAEGWAPVLMPPEPEPVPDPVLVPPGEEPARGGA